MHKLIVHGGLHKTGTSALQRFFSINKSWLLSKGVVYPDPKPFEAHHELADLVRCASVQEGKSVLARFFEATKSKEVEQTLLISSEIFSESVNPLVFSAVRDYFDEVEFVFYVRRQDELIESAYKQQVRQNRERRRIWQYEPYMTDLFSHCDWFAQSVPFGRVFALEYNKEYFSGGSIFQDFCSRILKIPTLHGANTTRSQVNESLGPLSAELIRRIKSLDREIVDRENLITALIESSDFEKSYRLTLIPDDFLEVIMKNVEDSNSKLRKNFLKSGDMIFKAENSGIFLSDQVFVDLMVENKEIEKIFDFLSCSKSDFEEIICRPADRSSYSNPAN